MSRAKKNLAMVVFLSVMFLTFLTILMTTPFAMGIELPAILQSSGAEVAEAAEAVIPAEEEGVMSRILSALSGGKSGWGFAVLFLLTTVYSIVSKTRYKGHINWALGLLWEGAEVPLAVLSHIKDPKTTTHDEVIKECKDVVVVWKQRGE
jgi:hypothetical protein